MGIAASKATAVNTFRPGIVVTLDALGTIYRFREPITTQYLKVAGRCGLQAQIQDSDLNKAFRKSFKEISAEYPNFGKGVLNSPRRWWKTVVNDAFRQVVDEKQIPDHLGDELYDHFKSSAAYEIYPDVKPFFSTMRELKQQWSKKDDPVLYVGVISNSDPRVKSVLQSLGLRIGYDHIPATEGLKDRVDRAGSDYVDIMKSSWHNAYDPLNDVDFLVTSYQANAEKPNTRIFDYADTLSGLVYASEIEQQREDFTATFDTLRFKLGIGNRLKDLGQWTYIHIGDDYEKDYVGARDHGFEVMHLVREGEQEAIEGATTVKTLEEAAVMIKIMANSVGKERDPDA